MSGSSVVMVACCELGEFLLPRLAQASVAIAHIVTINERTAAAANVAGYVDLRPLAESLEIPISQAATYGLDSPADVEFFKSKRFDLLIQGGWQRLIPVEILSTLRVGAVGVHGSADLLPKGRGRSPMNWSIIEGRKRFVMQYFLMTPGADDGAVFDEVDFDITPFDTIRTMYFKNAVATTRVLTTRVSHLLDGTATLRPQIGNPTSYPKRSPDDGWIDWEELDVWRIHDLVRALTRPYPGAFGTIDGKVTRIWRAQVFDTRIRYPAAAYGEVVERFGQALIVNCRGGLLLVEEYEATAT